MSLMQYSSRVLPAGAPPLRSPPPNRETSVHRETSPRKEAHPVKKRIAPLAILVAALLATAACGGNATPAPAGAAPTKVTLTLNWVPYGEHAPFYYGVKKGFYKAEGID